MVRLKSTHSWTHNLCVMLQTRRWKKVLLFYVSFALVSLQICCNTFHHRNQTNDFLISSLVAQVVSVKDLVWVLPISYVWMTVVPVYTTQTKFVIFGRVCWRFTKINSDIYFSVYLLRKVKSSPRSFMIDRISIHSTFLTRDHPSNVS